MKKGYSLLRPRRLAGRGMFLDREVTARFQEEVTFEKRPEKSQGKRYKKVSLLKNVEGRETRQNLGGKNELGGLEARRQAKGLKR